MGMFDSSEPIRTQTYSPSEKPISQTVAEVDKILTRHGFRESSLIAILMDIQANLNFLPQKALARVAEGLGIPLHRMT